MKKKSLLLVLACYFIWGFQPLYWVLLEHVDSYFLMAARVLSGALVSVLFLAVQGRLAELAALFKNKATMKYLVPAAFLLLADGGLELDSLVAGLVTGAVPPPGDLVGDAGPEEDEEVQQRYHRQHQGLRLQRGSQRAAG